MKEAPVVLRFVRLREGADEPRRASEQATGYDISTCLGPDGFLDIGPDPVRVPTGLAIEAPFGCDVQLRPRSGLSAKGVMGVFGTLDADYRGEVFITLYTVGSRDSYRLRDGDRIAQLVVSRSVDLIWQEAESLSESARGSGGHGSTGR